MSLNTLLSTPYGPTATFGRNIASIGSALMGAACTVLPALQGSPPSSILFFGLVGVVLISGFLFHLFRWRRIVRIARRAPGSADVRGAVPFIRAKVVNSSNMDRHFRSGWMLILSDRIVVRTRRNPGQGKQAQMWPVVLFDSVASVSRSETTSFSYTELIVELSTGERWLFTLAPSDGSGWRGPSEGETEIAVNSIKEAIKARE